MRERGQQENPKVVGELSSDHNLSAVHTDGSRLICTNGNGNSNGTEAAVSGLCRGIALPLMYTNIIITDHVQRDMLLVNLPSMTTAQDGSIGLLCFQP